eukprot:34733-Eustigmatos_ZCMA.PRE.1
MENVNAKDVATGVCSRHITFIENVCFPLERSNATTSDCKDAYRWVCAETWPATWTAQPHAQTDITNAGTTHLLTIRSPCSGTQRSTSAKLLYSPRYP